MRQDGIFTVIKCYIFFVCLRTVGLPVPRGEGPLNVVEIKIYVAVPDLPGRAERCIAPGSRLHTQTLV